MPLDELLGTVERLRGRIGEHGQSLRKSETLTRHALIDPLLRELGWDTSNPDQVVPEYPSSGGRADYALLAEGTPRMMVEAKKLGEQMRGAVSQGINYCLEKGTLYFAVTDGQSWEIYETHKPVPVEQKRIVEFDLLKDAPSDVCLKALSLWRPSVARGTVQVAETPITDTESAVTPPPPPDEGAWVSLAQVPTSKGTPLPPELRLPDGTTKGISSWAAILVEVTRWLIAKDAIQPHTLPLKGSANNYILATSPVGPTGKAFKNAQQVGEIWLAPHGNIFGTLQKAHRIIEHAGRNPADFQVRLAE